MCVLRIMEDPSEIMVSQAVADYESQLTAYAMTILHDRDRARDVVQDTFIRLNKQDPDKMGKGLKSWLFTVCRNRALDVLRKEKRMTALEDDHLKVLPGSEESPLVVVDHDERHAQVQTYLHRLTDNQRTVIILKFQQGLSYKEISETTGLSTGNVGFLIHAGLKKLRSLLPDDLLS